MTVGTEKVYAGRAKIKIKYTKLIIKATYKIEMKRPNTIRIPSEIILD